MEQGGFKIAVPAKKDENVNTPENKGTNEEKNIVDSKDVNNEQKVVKTKSKEDNSENITVIQEETGDNKVNEAQGSSGTSIPELSNTQAPQETSLDYPEGINDLVSFINETGGTIQDYVNLNKDVDSLSDTAAIKEYYKATKPHLTGEDLDFYIEDRFLGDPDLDDDRAVKLKGIAYKEEVAKAKKHINDSKEKYYKEIKGRQAPVDPKAQEAMDFFKRFKKDQQQVEERKVSIFESSKNYLTQNEGFDFDLGSKKVKYKYKDGADLASKQSSIQNFVQKFVGKNGELDYGGYHKALYVANNADKMIKSFYEQGRADMAKEMTAQGKNIQTSDNAPSKTINAGGMTFKVLNSDSSHDFKIKKR